jgi:hypothetical protein
MDEMPDLEPKFHDFEYRGGKYRLMEAPAAAAARFKNFRQKAMKLEKGEIVGFNDGVGDLEIVLVGGCVFKRNAKDEIGSDPVGPEVVRPWSFKLVKWLYDKALELCPELAPTSGATKRELQEQIRKLEAALAEGQDGPKGAPSGTEDTST